MFKHHLLDNILGSRENVAQILGMFASDPSLGMMFPPIVNIAYPTMGHSWFHNRAPAEDLAAELGITVPFDQTTPLSAYGSMFWARPAAVRRMAEREWRYAEFPEDGEYRDGSLTHVMERLLSYCALNDGYYVRCVMNTDWAAINYTFLEYKLQALAARLPHLPTEQVAYLDSLNREGGVPFLLTESKRTMRARYPRASRAAAPLYSAARWAYRRLQK